MGRWPRDACCSVFLIHFEGWTCASLWETVGESRLCFCLLDNKLWLELVRLLSSEQCALVSAALKLNSSSSWKLGKKFSLGLWGNVTVDKLVLWRKVMRYLLLYATDYSLRNKDICSNNCIFVWDSLIPCVSYWKVFILKVRQKNMAHFELPPAHPDSISLTQQLSEAPFPFRVKPMTPRVQMHKKEIISQQVKVMLITTPGTSYTGLHNSAFLSHARTCCQSTRVKTQTCSRSVLLQSE